MTIRLFIALEVPAPAVVAVEAWADLLEKHPARPRAARMCVAAPMHVTLKFLGETDEAALPALEAIVASAPGFCRAPLVQSARLIAFPRSARAHVVAVELADDGGLAKLAAHLDGEVARLGFARDTRAYRPHVTLARLKVARDVRAWIHGESDAPLDAPLDATLDQLVLVRSELLAQGAAHTVLARARLAR